MINTRLIDEQYINTHSYKDDMNSQTMLPNQIKPNVKYILVKSARVVFDCSVLVFLIVGPGIVFGG